jgi:hypothetical protein
LLAVAPGTFSNFHVTLSAAAGAGKTWTVTYRVNHLGTIGSSAVTCTIANPATTCADTTHSATWVAGDSVDVSVVKSGTAGNANATLVSFYGSLVPN